MSEKNNTEKQPKPEKEVKKDNEKSDSSCFIITPIGQVGSEINKKAFGLIEAVITPVLKKFDYNAIAASDISSSGSINRQIIKHLTEDTLVIANLTGLNPNVMYELAVRHAARKPVILMIEDGSNLPFDVFDQRTVYYEDNLKGVETAKDKLEKFVSSALKETEIHNPIYDSIEASLILQKVNEPSETPYQYIVDRLDRIESSLNNVRSGNVNKRIYPEDSTNRIFNHTYKIKVATDNDGAELFRSIRNLGASGSTASKNGEYFSMNVQGDVSVHAAIQKMLSEKELSFAVKAE